MHCNLDVDTIAKYINNKYIYAPLGSDVHASSSSASASGDYIARLVLAHAIGNMYVQSDRYCIDRESTLRFVRASGHECITY